MKLLDPKTRAILVSGLIRPTDYFLLLLFCLGALTVLQWSIFGQPTATQLLVVLVAAILLLEFWIFIFVVRIGVMFLTLRADINLMPAHAAQMVRAAQLGGAPALKKV